MNVTIEAEMNQKAEKFYLSCNEIVKTIELERDAFLQFKYDPLGNYSFIAENAELAAASEGWTHQCLLILGKGHDDGILVNTAGYDYARNTAYVPHARNILMVQQMPPALRELNQKVLDAVEQITNRCTQLVEQDGSGALSFDEVLDTCDSFENNPALRQIYIDTFKEKLTEQGINIQMGNDTVLQLECPAIRQERQLQKKIADLIAVCDPKIQLGSFEYPESDYPWAIDPVKDSAEMLEHFQFGNYATRSGFVLDDLAFVEMVGGGNEWLTLKHDGKQWHDINVYSMYNILQKNGPDYVKELVDWLHTTPYSEMFSALEAQMDEGHEPKTGHTEPEFSSL